MITDPMMCYCQRDRERLPGRDGEGVSESRKKITSFEEQTAVEIVSANRDRDQDQMPIRRRDLLRVRK